MAIAEGMGDQLGIETTPGDEQEAKQKQYDSPALPAAAGGIADHEFAPSHISGKIISRLTMTFNL